MIRIHPVSRPIVILLAFIGLAPCVRGETLHPEWTSESKTFLSALVDDRAFDLVEPGTVGVIEKAAPLVKKAKSLEGPKFYEGGKEEAAELRNEALGIILDSLKESANVIRVNLETDPRPLKKVGPIRLAGDKDYLLFRIESGTSELKLTKKDYRMGHDSRKGAVEIETSADGVTWALLCLTEAPKVETYFVVQFNRSGQKPVRMPILAQAPPPSRLRVAVLSEKTGEPVPFMVSLRWGQDGAQRRPPNALDLESQFESNGNVASLRSALLAGDLSGEYWCVPGPFDMSLPPGEWTLRVRRGLEFVPVTETFNLEPGASADKEFTLRNWANMPEKGWYSGDDHVHLRVTSDTQARVAMDWVQAEGIHLANILEMGTVATTHFNQRGFGKEFRMEDGGTYLVPGQEGQRTHHQLGHTIRLNTQGVVRFPDRYFLYDLVYDEVHNQGGLSGFAHVNSGIFFITRSLTLNLPEEKVDFVEVFQFKNLGTDLLYEFLNMGFPLTLSAGSDVPWGGTVGEERVYVYLGDRPFTPDNWFEEFDKGRTFVTNGPMLEFTADGALPGDTVSFSETREFKVKARAWGDAERFLPKRLDLLRQGEVIASVTNTGEDLASLELDFDLEESEGCWLAVRAKGDDGSVAHTTPIYLVREGLRFWKHDRVPGLLENRARDLDEVEDLVEEATRLIDEGVNLLDTENSDKAAIDAQVMNDSGPELLQRVEKAREFYSSLAETYEKEKELR